MNTSPLKDISDDEEKELENLLSRFKPLPSSRFTNRMLSAPWRRATAPQSSRIFSIGKSSPRSVWALCLMLVALILGGALVIPQVRAIARQIIYSFILAPSNRIEVQVTPPSSGELFNYTDPSNFPLSLEGAQDQAGFNLKQVMSITKESKFVGARYDADNHSAVLLYQGDNFVLLLTERLIGSGQDVFSIGQEAIIESVMIGDIPGEFVEGGWKAVSTQPAGDNPSTKNPINITAIWDSGLPQSTLRWRVDEFTYELRALGENRPSQSDLINWANELK